MELDTGAVLLGQILDAPDDDTPKLVYADWLEERGEPYAELIRAHCAKRAPDARVLAELAERLAPLAPWMQHDRYFAGGILLDHISLTAGKYAQKATQALLARFLPRYGVRTTLLSNHGGKVHACSTLAWTTALWWSNCNLTDYETAQLAESPHLARLTSLVLEKPGCANDGLVALARSPGLRRLRHLGLISPPHGGNYDAAGILALVEELPIVHLDLGGTRNKIDTAVFDEPAFAKLTDLAITTTRWLPLARSRHLTSLRSLAITASGPRTDPSVLALLDNPSFAQLERLELHVDNLGDDVIERLQHRFGDRWNHDFYRY